jgi:hypothetical protein
MEGKMKIIVSVFLLIIVATFLAGSGVTSAAYSTIQNAGSSLTQRSTMNFTSGCTPADNPGANRTDIACTGGFPVQVNGTPLSGLTTLNLAAGSGMTLTPTGSGTYTVTFVSSGGTATGGVIGYSAPVVTLPAAGTTFIPPVGGGLPSSTEANVQATAPISSAISNMYVVMSAAIGAGNSIAFTYRDNASSQAVTCTISGASAKTCSDTTHSFTPSVGDQLAIQIVTTGTVVATPNIQVTTQYGAIGGGGGGTSVHHQYYMASGATTGGSTQMMDVNGVSASFLSATPFGTVGNFGSGGGGVAGIIIFLPSSWSSAAGITVTADASPSDNSTGNFSFKPQYFCVPNGYDLGGAPSYTAGTPVSVAAPGGSGTGFYRESIAMTLASPTCSAGNSMFIAVTRPAGDSYTHNVILYGLDIGITY